MGQSASARERRAAIVAAAMRVLAREGITEATTRKNAAEAGVTLAMNGYYFGGKDELLHVVLLEMMRRTGEIASASLPERHGFAKTLAGAVEAFWRHVEQTNLERAPKGAEEVPSVLDRLLAAHERILMECRGLACDAEDNGDFGTNDLLVSDVIRTNELQVWFIAEHMVDTPSI